MLRTACRICLPREANRTWPNSSRGKFGTPSRLRSPFCRSRAPGRWGLMCCERLKIAFCWVQRPFFLQAQRLGGNESDNLHLRQQCTERARRVGATCLGAFAMAYGARAGACRRGTSALRRYDGAASGRYGAGPPPGDRCGPQAERGTCRSTAAPAGTGAAPTATSTWRR